MPTFAYKAADTSGRVVRGQMDGESLAAVGHALQQRALTLLDARQAKTRGHAAKHAEGAFTTIRLHARDVLDFSRQMRVMLSGGITVLSTLALLRQRARGDYRALLDRLAADIQRGKTLSEALAAHPRTFDSFYVGSVRAGEAGGMLTEALTELIAYYERRAALRKELVGALTYPAIVVMALIGACIVMLTWVVPQFESIFATGGGTLPVPTRVLLATSNFIRDYKWALLAGLLFAGVLGWLVSPLPRVCSAVGHAATRLPLFGKILYLSTVVQFARMFALLERAGLPLPETFKVISEMLIPGPVRELCIKIRRDISTGSSISDAVGPTRVLPELVEQMISVGEESGHLEETLGAAADHFDEEIRVRIRRMTTALEPLLTLLVSGVVLVVALAVFLPMWESNRLMLQH